MVQDAPTIQEILPYFIQFLGEDVFVAHNASFDFGFLEHNCSVHHSHRLENHKLCTRKLANRLLPDLPRKRLQDLCEHFDVANLQAHRAMADTKATAEIFSHLLDHLESAEISTIEEIIRFQDIPKQKASQLLRNN